MMTGRACCRWTVPDRRYFKAQAGGARIIASLESKKANSVTKAKYTEVIRYGVGSGISRRPRLAALRFDLTFQNRGQCRGMPSCSARREVVFRLFIHPPKGKNS
jgi:hypothetical protein